MFWTWEHASSGNGVVATGRPFVSFWMHVASVREAPLSPSLMAYGQLAAAIMERFQRRRDAQICVLEMLAKLWDCFPLLKHSRGGTLSSIPKTKEQKPQRGKAVRRHGTTPKSYMRFEPWPCRLGHTCGLSVRFPDRTCRIFLQERSTNCCDMVSMPFGGNHTLASCVLTCQSVLLDSLRLIK